MKIDADVTKKLLIANKDLFYKIKIVAHKIKQNKTYYNY